MTWILCFIVTKKRNARLGFQRRIFPWARVLQSLDVSFNRSQEVKRCWDSIWEPKYIIGAGMHMFGCMLRFHQDSETWLFGIHLWSRGHWNQIQTRMYKFDSLGTSLRLSKRIQLAVRYISGESYTSLRLMPWRFFDFWISK